MRANQYAGLIYTSILTGSCRSLAKTPPLRYDYNTLKDFSYGKKAVLDFVAAREQ